MRECLEIEATVRLDQRILNYLICQLFLFLYYTLQLLVEFVDPFLSLRIEAWILLRRKRLSCKFFPSNSSRLSESGVVLHELHRRALSLWLSNRFWRCSGQSWRIIRGTLRSLSHQFELWELVRWTLLSGLLRLVSLKRRGRSSCRDNIIKHHQARLIILCVGRLNDAVWGLSQELLLNCVWAVPKVWWPSSKNDSFIFWVSLGLLDLLLLEMKLSLNLSLLVHSGVIRNHIQLISEVLCYHTWLFHHVEPLITLFVCRLQNALFQSTGE